MIGFDRFVVHVDNDEDILKQLKQTIEPLGFPVDLSKGRLTQGFSISNIWIGKQNIEIVRLLQPDATGWDQDWVERYNQGERGIFGIFITTRDLDGLHGSLVDRGVNVTSPKQPGIKDLLGLVGDLLGIKKITKKSPTLRYITLPPIPGTDLNICFVEYDPKTEEELEEARQPNSLENGITGLHKAKIYLPMWEEGIEFLQTVFPRLEHARSQYKVELKEAELLFYRSDPEDGLKLKLEARCETKIYARSRFKIEDVEVKAVPG